MPLGIPKVVFQGPGDEEPDCNRLYNLRFLFLCQELDYEKAAQLCSLLVNFTVEDPKKEFFLFINSPGGALIPGLTVYDFLRTLGPDVNTICMGTAASMASLLLAVGTVSKRIAYPGSRVMIHEPEASKFTASMALTVKEAEELAYLRQRVIDTYKKHTIQSQSRIESDLERDTFMTAKQALAYGIIDKIAYSVDGLYQETLDDLTAEERDLDIEHNPEGLDWS
uniref:ATP-dependent Clp protease proteolytic subunit n=1 Tax=Incarvillea compacta TaxID=291318 RepID=A0A7G7XQV8_9LAMI|nr:clp protease proteolytic subunit [Incarvillea compacta]QNH82799.1 clp protease proteolytic subunit [Incarvillea compacta]